jgi:ligand-binding SRPBCC domain-containing protein
VILSPDVATEEAMPVFNATQLFPRPLVEVFDFFCQPINLTRISPPDLQMRLVEAPPRIQLGSRITLLGRRWGVPQRLVSQVILFQPNTAFTDEQCEGPFRKWTHVHRFEIVPGGTRVVDRIEFEPPGGILGLMVNAAAIDRDLKWLYEYRSQKLREILGELAS